MFTGIIEEVGTVLGVRNGGNFLSLTIGATKVLESLRIGDSIAVNGVCLTVVSFDKKSFTADVMHETMKRTVFASARGERINLERALPVNGRFGGHIVGGHIDGVGKIVKIVRDGIADIYTIRAADNIMRYIAEKGSVSVDGISLTVASAGSNVFAVSVIPHTLQNTALRFKRLGDNVNIENDIIGKYIEKFMCDKNEITRRFLTDNGY